MEATIRQYKPIVSVKSESVLPHVYADLNARSAFGKMKYGTELVTHNGRDALTDAYQEVLDLAVYLKQLLLERDAEHKVK
jgi:hypothetical protein